jgi:hypothetical protein
MSIVAMEEVRLLIIMMDFELKMVCLKQRWSIGMVPLIELQMKA